MVEKDAFLRDLIRSGQKLEAIKHYRERYGGGLSEARDYVEALASDDGVTGYATEAGRWEQLTDSAFRDAMEGHLQSGNLISAIRCYQEKYSEPLPYAKKTVLAWRSFLGLTDSLEANLMGEQVETFDIRWNVAFHSERRFLAWKQAEAFLEVRFELQIGDVTTASSFPLAWDALAASREGDGDYGIFTCICGVPGCGDFSAVEVVYLNAHVLWYDRNDIACWHLFDERQYRAAIDRFDIALRELPRRYPTVAVRFE